MIELLELKPFTYQVEAVARMLGGWLLLPLHAGLRIASVASLTVEPAPGPVLRHMLALLNLLAGRD